MASPLITRVAILTLALFPTALTAQLETKLSPTSGAPGGAYFGTATAVDGATIVVGASTDDDNGFLSGSAYLFDSSTGALITKLLPTDGAVGDFFGTSVSISGNTVIVGAPGDDDGGADSGSAYLFDATTGVQTMKLVPGPGTTGNGFGTSVDVDGTTAAVGSPRWNSGNGRVQMFDTATGSVTATVTNPSRFPSAVEFGRWVVIEGTTLLVTSPGDDEVGFNAGAAYLIDISGGTPGVVTSKLIPIGPQEAFGWTSVDLSGSRVVVGAYRDEDGGLFSGAAYLFDASTGDLISKVTPEGLETGDQFGASVALSGGVAVVGAPGKGDLGSNAGSAYLLDAATGIQLAKIRASDGLANAAYGSAVAIDGTTAVLGAPNPTTSDSNGAAYVYDTDDLPGMWTDLGGASPGIDGLPTLTAFGTLTSGSLLDIELQQAAPNAFALAWLSFTSTPFNVLGGTLYANPYNVQFLRFTVTGAISDSLVWPAGIPAGIDMYLQFLVNDVTVPAQITLSNAVMATTP